MDPALLQPHVQHLGLKPSHLRAWLALDRDDLPYRVAAVGRGRCELLGIDAGGALCDLQVRPPAEPIAVGDWVGLGPEDALVDDLRGIDTVLPRLTWLRRGSAHTPGQTQEIAANLDTVFVVAAFATTDKLQRRALQARRLDRFIAVVSEGGATPVVVLNKLDLASDDTEGVDDLRRNLSRRLGGVQVLATSVETEHGLDALKAYLPVGDTVAFIGPSGVGKSSLTNALAGQQVQRASSVRDADAKGRHTTTRGSLIPLPSGALIIDTPGVRQLALLADADVSGFDDIEALAAECRFADCGHGSEPGCAVRAAVDGGELPEERLQSYQQLQAEQRGRPDRTTGYARKQQHQAERRLGRLYRQAQQRKKR